MSVATRVREIYERHPYPPPSSRAASSSWALAAIPWLEAVTDRVAAFPPRRILIAGCGVGTEAFDFARKFPGAVVVGVDLSPRSISMARRTARKSDLGGRVSFEVADLSAADLPLRAGRKFDLISCHGVLSYIPDAQSVFRNFVRCLAPDGLVVLGVNGAGHPSLRWRPVLGEFGLDARHFCDGSHMRQVLRVFDSLTRNPPIALAGMPAGYLAGDLFGPMNRAITLAGWLELMCGAQLHLLTTLNSHFAIRSLLNDDLHRALMPRSRGEVAELVDALEPASFHRIVLSRRAPKDIPWRVGRRLLGMRPFRTALYSVKWPRRRAASWHDLQKVVLESVSTGTKVTLEVPQWEVMLLREADGERSMREMLKQVRPAAAPREVAEAMYLLYQLAAVNVRP